MKFFKLILFLIIFSSNLFCLNAGKIINKSDKKIIIQLKNKEDKALGHFSINVGENKAVSKDFSDLGSIEITEISGKEDSKEPKKFTKCYINNSSIQQDIADNNYKEIIYEDGSLKCNVGEE